MEKLKKSIFMHKVVTVMAVIICVLLAILWFKTSNKNKVVEQKLNLKEQKDSVVKAKIQSEATLIAKKVDKEGIEHAIFDVTNKTFPKSIFDSEVIKSTFVDSTAKRLDIKSKQITDLTVVVSTLKAEKLQLNKEVDSLKREFYVYNDNLIKLRFTPADSVTNMPAFADLTVNGKLTTTQYTRQKIPFIGKKRTFIDIFPADTRMTINGLNKFTVEQQQPAFGLRLQLRSIYGITTHKFYAGPGISFDFGRFNILGYTYYNYTDNRWQNVFGVNYDIVRF